MVSHPGLPAPPPLGSSALPAGTYDGTVVLITGGGTGLGLGMAVEFARLGATVAVASRSEEHRDAGVAAVSEVGPAGLSVPLDIRDPEAIEVAFNLIEDTAGPVDVLVNNAAGNFPVPAEDLSPNGWRAVTSIVLDGTFLMCREFARRHLAHGTTGSVLNIGASYAWTGGPGFAHSAAAKAGVKSLTESLAVEWAPYGLRVNGLVPGLFPHDDEVEAIKGVPGRGEREREHVSAPALRPGERRELGWAATFLCSPYASYVTGHTMVVDGANWQRRAMLREPFTPIREQLGRPPFGSSWNDHTDPGRRLLARGVRAQLASRPMDPVYRPVIGVVLALFRSMRWELRFTGTEHIPRTGGGVIATNHVGYLDFTFVGAGVRTVDKRLLRFLAKKEVFDHKVAGPLMRGMKHIPVDRGGKAADSLHAAEEALRQGELIGMFPEATINRSFVPLHGKTGAARMAIDTGTPLVPGAVWGSQRIWTKGRPRNFERDVVITVDYGPPIPTDGRTAEAVTNDLMTAIGTLVDKAQRNYPEQAPDDERWWLPAHLGGTAPTPKEAATIAAREAEERRARRAARANPEGDADSTAR